MLVTLAPLPFIVIVFTELDPEMSLSSKLSSKSIAMEVTVIGPLTPNASKLSANSVKEWKLVEVFAILVSIVYVPFNCADAVPAKSKAPKTANDFNAKSQFRL